MFKSLLACKDACPHCGCELASRDIGDGAIFLSIVLVGALVTIMSIIVEFSYEPSLWVHAVIWPPTIMILSLLCLRWGRAAMMLFIITQEQSS